MAKLYVKRAVVCITLCTFWAIGTFPSAAQTFSTGVGPDPEVLVSPAQALNNISLVDIKAVDAPELHRLNDKVGVGTEIRYGQGIIIDPAGIIATNRHIIGNAEHIYVALSGGKTFEASVLQNSQADLTLIKIDAPFPLRAISMADPSEIQIGNHVTAIANPDFDPQRIKGGQIIKVYKEITTNKAELMEMNISLKPGDSGGPVLNKEGSLVGLIMGKKISDPTKSYAIASSRIQQEYSKYRDSILN